MKPFNNIDMTFKEMQNVIIHSLDDTGELGDTPYLVGSYSTNEQLAFRAGLMWYSQYGQRFRYTGSDYTFAGLATQIVHSVARVLNFTQGVLTDLWEIEHNFGPFQPVVLVFDDDGNAIDAAVTRIDENNLTIGFVAATTGSAVLLG